MAQWNSGRRETRWYKAEQPRIGARLDALRAKDRELRARFGTRWPQAERDEYVAEETALREDLEEIYDSQFEPWFPDDVINEIETRLVTLDDVRVSSPRLLEDLFRAVYRLAEGRTRQDQQGIPFLSAPQRRRLERARRSMKSLIQACGSGVEPTDVEHIEETNRLIGGSARLVQIV